MPPRKKQASGSSNLKQKTLDGFVAPEAPSSPPAPSAGQKRKRVASSHSASRRALARESEDSDSEGVETIRFEPRRVNFSSDDEIGHGSSPRRPKRSKKSTALPSRAASSQERSIDSSSDSDEVEIVEPRTTGRRGKQSIKRPVQDDEGHESDEERPRMRRLRKGIRPATPDEELMDEVNEDAIIEGRLRSRESKKTTFQKNLERLKRKKRGLAAKDSSSEHSEATSEDGDSIDAPFADAKPDAGSDPDEDDDHVEPEDSSNQDESWIVEDDGDGSASALLPTEFSMNTHQDLIHHFKVICQLFVHLAVLPAEERAAFMMDQSENNDYFKVPLTIARRKLSGIRDVSVASSVWRPAFRKPLLAYSEFTLTRLDFAVPHCDACHLGGRLSTFAGRVLGTRYDPLSFEPIGRTSVSNADSESEDEDSKHRGGRRRSMASTIKAEYNLGRFCAARTQVFHSLSHWEYELFHSLLQEVDDLRNRAEGGKPHFVRVAFSKGLQPPDDLTDADAIMDWLDERGVISMEWHKIKQLMERAMQLEAKAGKREDEIDLDVS